MFIEFNIASRKYETQYSQDESPHNPSDSSFQKKYSEDLYDAKPPTDTVGYVWYLIQNMVGTYNQFHFLECKKL